MIKDKDKKGRRINGKLIPKIIILLLIVLMATIVSANDKAQFLLYDDAHCEGSGECKEMVGAIAKAVNLKITDAYGVGDISDRTAAISVLNGAVDICKESSISHCYYAIGNHENDECGVKKWKDITGMSSDFYYVDMDWGRFVVINTGEHLSADGLKQLKEALNTKQRIIIFNHYPLSGTSFDPDNSAEIRKVLESAGNVVAVLSGHIHQDSAKKINGIWYFTQDALEYGVYYIVTVTDTNMQFAGYGSGVNRNVPIPTPVPTSTPIPSPAPTITIIPTPSPTPVPTVMPIVAPMPIDTIIVTPTPTPTPILEPTPVPTDNITVTPTIPPTANATPVVNTTPTPTATVNMTPALTSTFTATPTPTVAVTVIPTPFVNATPNATDTPITAPTSERSSGGGSSGGSSGGSGGGAMSCEAYNNTKQRYTIDAEVSIRVNPMVYNFNDHLGSIIETGFTPLSSYGTVTAKGETLYGRSACLDVGAPGSEIYYFNIWVGLSGYGDSDKIIGRYVLLSLPDGWKAADAYVYDRINQTWVKVEHAITDESLYNISTPLYGNFALIKAEEEQAAPVIVRNESLNLAKPAQPIQMEKSALVNKTNEQTQQQSAGWLTWIFALTVMCAPILIHKYSTGGKNKTK